MRASSLTWQVNNATARVQTKKPPTVPNGMLKLSYHFYPSVTFVPRSFLPEMLNTRAAAGGVPLELRDIVL